MKEKYYLDTSIWLDVYEKRGENSKSAKKLLEKIILENSKLLYSDMISVELKKLHYSSYEACIIFSIDGLKNIERLHVTKMQLSEAKKIAKQRNVPSADAVHAILARDHEAQLISRDWDFQKLKDITIVKSPDELI